MSETSGGSYERKTISFGAPVFDGNTVYSALGPWHPLTHLCDLPDATEDAPPTWTCPECRRVHTLHAEYWWEPDDIR